MAMVTPSDPPTYFYTGTQILEQMNTVFSTNKPTPCPINAYDCLIDGTSTPCESILTGTDTAVTFDRSGGGFSFLAQWTSIPANLPGTYAIRFSAESGTTNDVTQQFTYTVTLRCMI